MSMEIFQKVREMGKRGNRPVYLINIFKERNLTD
jgi:hypothetical protein